MKIRRRPLLWKKETLKKLVSETASALLQFNLHIITESQPDTPQEPEKTPQIMPMDKEIEEEVDAGEGRSIASAYVAEAASNDMSDPATELPATETDYGQEFIAAVDGHPSVSAANLDAEAAGGQEESGTPGPALSEQSNPSSTPAYVNGTGSSHTTLTENDDFTSQQESSDRGYGIRQQSISSGGAVRDKTVNGYHHPPTALFAPPALVPRSFNALPSLQEHLLQLSATKEGADILIQLNPTNSQPFISYSHSIILYRSLRLRRLLTRQQQANNSYGSNIVTLYPARYVMPHAFEAALRFLYSDTVLGKDFLVQQHTGADYQTVRVHNLDYLLSYWVSGIELGLEPVAICAERLLSNHIDWDILEITYKYAADLATSPALSHRKSMTGSEYVVASNSIVKLILQFLASNIDIKSFRLDTSADTHLIPSRLPQLDDGRPRPNPALATMVFGSMPTSADMSPSSSQSESFPAASTFKDSVASNILLNVDFENLNAFNNFIQAPTVHDAATTRMMLDIVTEREARRQKMYSSHITNKERMANSVAWEAVGLRESITETNVLIRDRMGFMVSSK